MHFISIAPIRDDQRKRLELLAPDDVIRDSHKFHDDGVGDLVDADTEVLYAFRVPNDILDRAPNLRWLQLLGAGCDHLQGNPILDSDVKISTASGVHATPIAEYVLGVNLGF